MTATYAAAAAVDEDERLRERQPWKAVHEGDRAWLGASGGGRDFMRPITEEVYGIPRELGIWSRTRRRPLLAGGNSNGDVPMLEFAAHTDKPCLRLLVLHDDAEREFDYTTGAERALEQAAAEGWTVVSVKDDWATVF